MKIVSFEYDGRVRAGIVENDWVRDAGNSVFEPEPGEAVARLDDVTLLAPVPRPGKVVCIGLNYRDHAQETGQQLPSSPLVFAKFGNAVTGPGAPIVIPPFTTQVDYEAELGVVIERTTQRVSAEHALDSVFGYTCMNDVSARDLQFADVQWTRGKSLDTFCPIGPWVVTADDVKDPQALGIRCVVNDRVLQDSTTGNMIFGVAELISFISQGITLERGDVIATGTPSGVGFVRKPPVFLAPGDSVTISIEGIGDLTNPVIAHP
ncbi:MAG: fumarylacetoacetate hydrolase family protein [Actinomycetota bacterium]|nr:fumarylacetoacetate hydrolase family protein [Actinomycetota bacterium]